MASPEIIQKLLDGPALQPPPEVIPNLTDPPNLDSSWIATLVVCIFISTLTVFTRMYTKIFITRKVAWADYTSLLAWGMYIGFCGTLAPVTKYGAGIHQWNVSVRNASGLSHLSNTVEIVYGPTVFLTKLSILLQYHQIFVPTRAGNKLTFYSIHILIWTNLLLYFIDTFVEAFACTPREMIWNPFVTSGHCLNINANLVATASFNILSDFSIFALPLFVIWKLHLPTKEKIGVSAIFAVGLFGCIASIIRLLYTIKFVTAKDSTYTIFFVAVWAVVEIAIGIIVGCLPVLPRFFQHLTHSHTSFDSSRGSGGFNKHSKQSHTSSTSTSSTPAPPQRPTRPFSRSHSRSGTLVLNDFGNEIYEPLHERHVMSTHGYVELKGEGVGKSAGESIAMKELGMMEKEDGGNKGVDMDLEIRKAVRAETEERSIQMV